MKNRNLSIFVLLLLLVSACRENCIQGLGAPTSITIKTDSFNNVRLSHLIKYSSKIGEEFKIIAKSNSNLLDALAVKNDKGDLFISFKDGYYCTDINIDVELISPTEIKTIFEISGIEGESPAVVYTDSLFTYFISEGDTTKIKKP